MLIPTGLADSVAEIAVDLPEAVLRQIILALAPRAPVATRPPVGFDKMDAPRKLRTRPPSMGNRRFKAGPQLYKQHRPGTWRYAMITACQRSLPSTGMGDASCADAQRHLQIDFPDYAGRPMDWSFLTEREYVTLI